MKASKLIQVLQQLREKHGDFDVVVDIEKSDYGTYSPFDIVRRYYGEKQCFTLLLPLETFRSCK